MRRDDTYVLSRIDALRSENQVYEADKWRIRQIMNGGADGVRAIMAWDQGKGTSGRMNMPDLGTDLPAVNMMASGVERLGQSVGVVPTLRMPYGPKDSEAARRGAEKRERIVEGWDHLSRVHLTYPQQGRWLPGYGLGTWVIRPKIDPVTRQLYPHTEIRDPFDTWTGFFGPTQQPQECAYRKLVKLEVLTGLYGETYGDFSGLRAKRRTPQQIAKGGPPARSLPIASEEVTWEGPGGGTTVIEYYDSTGCYIVCPEFEMVLEYTPNICETGPMFVAGKRFAFDRLVSQYHHVIGLVAMMAKFNVLALVATEESSFSEINIFGEMEGNTYQRGKKGTNFFDANGRVEKPKDTFSFNIFTQIDRLTQQLRIGAAYDAGSDSLAARGGFITGRGQQELRDPMEKNVEEYRNIIATAMEEVDTRRLEWEERHERNRRKRVFWIEGGRAGEETYIPSKDIGGMWRSRRAYGMMATWDDNSKIVAGIQLLQSNVIDITTFQENLSGLDNLPQIRQRNISDRAEAGLLASLEQRAASQDPAAMLALIELKKRPDQIDEILSKFFTPAEPQPSPEEAMMLGGMPGQGAMPPEAEMGPGPTVQTVLSELEASGTTGGGVQTVNVSRR